MNDCDIFEFTQVQVQSLITMLLASDLFQDLCCVTTMCSICVKQRSFSIPLRVISSVLGCYANEDIKHVLDNIDEYSLLLKFKFVVAGHENRDTRH